MEFSPISTQEEFDSRVKELYGDVSDLQGQIQTLTGQVTTLTGERDTLQGKVKGFETSALRQRIAREKGIPPELADRITGETEADIRKDADVVAGMVRSLKGPAPLFDGEKKESNTDAALKQMLQDMEGV